ncbi:MAG: MarR family winged helix-turn-helix transcriptional regulator [Pollutimonas bauzanensis]|uniref:Transcriptional regulator, MarR family n=1 Tax=Pollutimonas bauzanensis TaxID=658167 RepID=A0A1M5Z761_9BURK|nr:MarR family transcriptional regulator [Pollutimonas bauzanensis]SHI19723.1 transcriptional regulator, MarR family [Pollutimonas bauzanensis]
MLKPAPSTAAKKSKASPAAGKTPRKQDFYTAEELSGDMCNNVGLLIKQVQSSLNRMIDLHVSPLGLTSRQWRPLVMIRYRNVNTPAELSRQAHVDTGAMTRTLDRLEAKKFLTRHRCPDDRRVVKLELTESGQNVADQILPAIATSLNTHLLGFSKPEVETMIALLQRMLVNGKLEESTCSGEQ